MPATGRLILPGLALTVAANVVAAQEPLPTFRAEDVFDLEYAADPRISPDGERIVYERRSNDIMTDSTRSNLWIVDVDGGQTAEVASLRDGPSELSWSPDGRWLAFQMPVKAEASPLAVPRSGPEGSEWSEPVRVFDAVRYKSDGEGFALALQYKYSSEADFADHMSGLDALIERGIADADRLFVTGGSAGGIATAYAIGLTDRFVAAAVQKPVINWVSKVLTADSYVYQIPYQFPGMPWEEPEHYWQRSPLSLVGNVTRPTLLIAGEDDQRTPISETEQFYQALKLRRVDTVMVRVPGASHGIAGRPSRLNAKVDSVLAWFARYRDEEDNENENE